MAAHLAQLGNAPLAGGNTRRNIRRATIAADGGGVNGYRAIAGKAADGGTQRPASSTTRYRLNLATTGAGEGVGRSTIATG